MSGNLPSGVTDADIDRAIENSESPCRWGRDGSCLTCGIGPMDLPPHIECNQYWEERIHPRDQYAYSKGWLDAVRFMRALEAKHLGRETED